MYIEMIKNFFSVSESFIRVFSRNFMQKQQGNTFAAGHF